MEPLVLNFEIDGDNFASAGTASSEAKRVLRRLGVDAETIRRASICMYEGEINMVIHAKGGTAELLFDGREIRLTLADRGPGIPDIQAAMTEGFSTANASARDLGFGAGMGLPNMKKYADEFSISSEMGVGTTVTMTVRPEGRD